MTAAAPSKPKFANDGSYESISRQLKGLAGKFFSRAQAIGIAMDFEDVVQELNIAYLRARAGWRVEGGARFSTFFQTCACRHFNHYIAKEEAERANLGMGSMSALIDKWGAGDDGDMPASIEAAMGDEDESPEDARERRQETSARIAQLSSSARRIVLALVVAERDRTNLRLRDACKLAGIEGRPLQAVKAELVAKFGVSWR